MSVKVSGRVWDHSKSTLGARLVMLYLADVAHEDGTNIYPSITTIAKNTRLSERQVQRQIKNLLESGELIDVGWSSVGTRQFQIKITEGGDNMSPRQIVRGDICDTKRGEGGDILSKNGGQDVTLSVRRDPLDQKTVTLVPDKQGPASESSVSVQEIFDSWNEICPPLGLPAIRELSADRRRKVAARLRVHPSVEFWREVFRELKRSPFLLGENKNGWRIRFDWLMKNDENCLKVVEGNYKNVAAR